jgi:hypothetical protein
VPDGCGIAGAIDYSLNRWKALGRFLCSPAANWAGQRAAVVMSLVHSARLNGHEPWAYLKDALTRLPLHPNSRIEELLPHRWMSTAGKIFVPSCPPPLHWRTR